MEILPRGLALAWQIRGVQIQSGSRLEAKNLVGTAIGLDRTAAMT